MITIIDKVKEKYNSIDIEKKAVLWTIVTVFFGTMLFVLLVTYPTLIPVSMLLVIGFILVKGLHDSILGILKSNRENRK